MNRDKEAPQTDTEDEEPHIKPRMSRRKFIALSGLPTVASILVALGISALSKRSLTPEEEFGPNADSPYIELTDLQDINTLQELDGQKINTKAHLQLIYENITFLNAIGFPAFPRSMEASRQRNVAAFNSSRNNDFDTSSLYVVQTIDFQGLAGMPEKRVVPPSPDDIYFIGGVIKKGRFKISESDYEDSYYLDAKFVTSLKD